MLTWLAALAVVAATAGNLHLVAVGVETYEDKSITPLKFAVADARAIAETFRAGGVPSEFVTVLTSDQTDAASRPTRDRLIAALQAVRDQATEQDRLVFFFAGHGVEQDGKQYLYTTDTRPDLLAETALPMPLVAKALEGIKAKQVLFIVDACRNDPRAGRGDVDAVMTEGVARGLRPRLAAGEQAGPQVAVLLSCEVGERSWEDPGSGHGLFTAALLKGMQGKGADADGVIRLEPLAEYVREEVARMAAAQQRQQEPSFSNPSAKEMELLDPRKVELVFDGTPLAAVIRALGNTYKVQIVLGLGADPARTVTGRVQPQAVEAGLNQLFGSGDLDWSRQGEVIVIWSWEASKPEGWPAYLKWPLFRDRSLRFRVAPKDGMPQVLIPAGEFVMGSPRNELGRRGNEGPQRRIFVSAFWMDLHEVTMKQYQEFCHATNRGPIWLGQKDCHPVAVAWEGAAAYCEWAGRRLPTEAEWEKAARGGREGQPYVWGNQWPPPRGAGDFKYYEYERGVLKVGCFAPNGYGLFDMAGNVSEWCQDWYDEGWYAYMPDKDPCNMTKGHCRVLRGGTNQVDNGNWLFRVAFRSEDYIGWHKVDRIGFRGVAGAAQGS